AHDDSCALPRQITCQFRLHVPTGHPAAAADGDDARSGLLRHGGRVRNVGIEIQTLGESRGAAHPSNPEPAVREHRGGVGHQLPPANTASGTRSGTAHGRGDGRRADLTAEVCRSRREEAHYFRFTIYDLCGTRKVWMNFVNRKSNIVNSVRASSPRPLQISRKYPSTPHGAQ